jgi:predicted nucleic acid-binding Zn ribbon protein
MGARRNAKSQTNQENTPTGPRPIASVISQLMARRGYNQLQLSDERETLWQNIAGERLSLQTRPGNVNRGVWEILAKNSVVVQELTFRKAELMKKLKELAPEEKVRELRFRVGAIDGPKP